MLLSFLVVDMKSIERMNNKLDFYEKTEREVAQMGRADFSGSALGTVNFFFI